MIVFACMTRPSLKVDAATLWISPSHLSVFHFHTRPNIKEEGDLSSFLFNCSICSSFKKKKQPKKHNALVFSTHSSLLSLAPFSHTAVATPTSADNPDNGAFHGVNKAIKGSSNFARWRGKTQQQKMFMLDVKMKIIFFGGGASRSLLVPASRVNYRLRNVGDREPPSP